MKIKRYISFFLLVTTLIVGGCKKEEKDKEKEEMGAPREIDVAEAVVEPVTLYKTYPGYITADYTAEVVGLVNGELLTRNYQQGSYVKKGQVLFTIDPTLYKDAVARAEATLKSNESSLQYAKSHYAAVCKALEDNAVSRMEVEQAESNYRSAEANVNDSKAALHTAQVNLGYCTVVAPISGYITESTVSPGNYISGSASPAKLAEIYDNTRLYAVFEIEDGQYLTMTGGSAYMTGPLFKSIPLKFDAPLAHDYTADLIYQAPSVDRSTGTVTLKGKVENKHNELRQGMYVTISLPYGQNPRAVLVKDAAIGTDQLGRYMYVVNDSNVVTTRRIEVGELYQDTLRVVNKGIQPGDKYVTKALLTVRAGEKVKPVLK